MEDAVLRLEYQGLPKKTNQNKTHQQQKNKDKILVHRHKVILNQNNYVFQSSNFYK